ncbi:MAG: hypothetical protein H6R45_1259, partial [Proteobacteria bacterium]|nr:hypothetical protein [Pseudomonadota bacterium]
MPGPAYPTVENYRYDWTALTEAAIRSAIDKVAMEGPKCASDFDISLAGKTMQIVADGGPYGAGPTLSYRFMSGNRLILSENGADGVNAG